MTDETTSHLDSAALLRSALHKSWRRDRWLGAWRLSSRWSLWWITRYGSSLIAAVLLSASTELLFDTAGHSEPVDGLKLKLSYEITLPPHTP
jgi:hypothetical protein